MQFTWPETKGVIGYNDITPRMGVAYDLFGTGKTAIKFNAGKYLEAAVNGNGNYSSLLPTSRIQLTQNRAWTDSNGNYTPDCDLLSGAAQNLTATGGDICGAWANPNFGKAVDANGNPIYSLGYAEKILKGWGTRPSDWQIGVTLQQEILPRVSVEVGYSRRWLQNFTVTDNLNVSPADFDQFHLVAPSDSRLPGGGGYSVSGLYNVKPDKFSVPVNDLRTYAPDYGTITQVYNGVDININARMRNGIQLQAGTTTGQRVTDYCDVRGLLPEQTGGFSTGSEVWVQSGQSVLQRETGYDHAVHERGQLHHSEDRRHAVGHVPKLTGRAASSELDGLECHRGADAGSSPLRWRPERDRQPARSGSDARGACESAGSADRQGAALRRAARHRVPGHVQRAQRGYGADLQPGLHAWRCVAGADHRADGADREDHCAVRLLMT